MKRKIIFIHGFSGGAWCFEKLIAFFENQGYETIAPDLPFHGQLKAQEPSPELGTTSIADYVDYIEKIIDKLDQKPIVIGHSMGGLIAQILASKNKTAKTILLAPAGPYGIITFDLAQVAAVKSILLQSGFWKKSIKQNFKEVAYSMFNQLPIAQQKETFKKLSYESGRAFFEMGFWFFDKNKTTMVKEISSPLLIVAGNKDRLTSPAAIKKIANKYRGNVVYKEFANRAHWLIEEEGWQEIAEYIVGWLEGATGNKKISTKNFNEARSELKFSLNLSKRILIGLGLVALLAKIVINLPFSSIVLLLIFGIIILFFIYENLIAKAKNEKDLYNRYLAIMSLEIILLTVIIHFIGGLQWIGGIFYIFILLMGSTMLPKKKVWVLAPMVILSYSTLAILEYLGIISPHYLFYPSLETYQSPLYIVTQIFAISIVCLFIIKSIGDFSELLRRKKEEVEREGERAIMSYQKSEEARKVLEEKIKERTSELEQLVAKQEKMVSGRTKELQEKVEELEKFHRLTIGRELKMVELKEKIKKQKLGKNNH